MRAIRCAEIAGGRFRAPDPWYAVVDGVAVRRLSPNSRKINATLPSADDDDDSGGIRLDVLLGRAMLEAMGAELAALHLGRADAADAIAADLKRREPAWLADLSTTAAEAVTADFRTL
jgi:hypothetical protein